MVSADLLRDVAVGAKNLLVRYSHVTGWNPASPCCFFASLILGQADGADMGHGLRDIVRTNEIIRDGVVTLLLLDDTFPGVIMAPVFKGVALAIAGTSALHIDVGVIREFQFEGVGRQQGTPFGVACGLWT